MRHSATIAAGVSRGSTIATSSSDAAAVAARRGPASGRLAGWPAARQHPACPGKQGRAAAAPVASTLPNENSGARPVAPAAGRSPPRPAVEADRVHLVCGQRGRRRPRRAGRRPAPGGAQQVQRQQRRQLRVGRAGGGDAKAVRRSTSGSGSRLSTRPGVTAARAGTQCAASKRARGSPTSQAMAALPGSSSAVPPSGYGPRLELVGAGHAIDAAHHVLADRVPGGSARPSPGGSHSAQPSTGPPFGPGHQQGRAVREGRRRALRPARGRDAVQHGTRRVRRRVTAGLAQGTAGSARIVPGQRRSRCRRPGKPPASLS